MPTGKLKRITAYLRVGKKVMTCGCCLFFRLAHQSTLVVDIEEIDAIRPSILLRLPTSTESLVKGYDLKPLSKYYFH